MKVYVLIEIDKEVVWDEKIVGVYSSKKSAEQCINDMEKNIKVEDDVYLTDRKFILYRIEEYFLEVEE